MKALAAGLALAALLLGCTAVPLAPRDAQPFDLIGRMLVTYSSGALTANVRWEHSAAEDLIWLMTPTGQTLAYIVNSPERATLTRADQKQYAASSVEALTRQALGWSLPLSLMQYWVKGESAPKNETLDIERGDNGRLLTVTQSGWKVAFTYYSEGEMRGRVRRLDLTDGANEIRLVVDTWRDAP